MIDKITEYLSNGGYFNPELMEHDKVRDLLMDVREQLAVYAKAIMDKDAEIERLRDMLITVSQWIDKDPAYSELHQQVLSAIRARGAVMSWTTGIRLS